jgi:hypothetical protein
MNDQQLMCCVEVDNDDGSGIQVTNIKPATKKNKKHNSKQHKYTSGHEQTKKNTNIQKYNNNNNNNTSNVSPYNRL